MENPTVERYSFVQDDDAHWYIIPSSRRKELFEIIDTEGEPYPDWAVRVNTHISRIEFSDPVFPK